MSLDDNIKTFSTVTRGFNNIKISSSKLLVTSQDSQGLFYCINNSTRPYVFFPTRQKKKISKLQNSALHLSPKNPMIQTHHQEEHCDQVWIFPRAHFWKKGFQLRQPGLSYLFQMNHCARNPHQMPRFCATNQMKLICN